MRKRVIAILAVIMLLMSTYPVFAAGITMFRDGDIEFDVPNDWTFDELSVEINEYDKYEMEQIIDAYPSEGDEWLYLYYIAEKAEDVYGGSYMGSEGTAMEYYEKYGKAFIDWYFGEHWAIPDAEISEPVYFSGEWENYLYVDVEYDADGEKYRLRGYLAANGYTESGSIVHIFQLYEFGTGNSEGKASLSEEIAGSFDDYEYGEVLCGTRTLDEDWVPGDDIDEEDDGFFDFLLSIAAPIIAIIATIIVKSKGDEADDDETLEDGPRDSTDDIITEGKLTEKLMEVEARQSARKAARLQKKAERQAAKPDKKDKPHIFRKAVDDREILKERSAKPGQTRKAEPVRTAAPRTRTQYHQQAEQRYITSLETLRKSGLLTKEEMQDMIDKHRRL